jgi:hypothetical protein
MVLIKSDCYKKIRYLTDLRSKHYFTALQAYVVNFDLSRSCHPHKIRIQRYMWNNFELQRVHVESYSFGIHDKEGNLVSSRESE